MPSGAHQLTPIKTKLKRKRFNVKCSSKLKVNHNLERTYRSRRGFLIFIF